MQRRATHLLLALLLFLALPAAAQDEVFPQLSGRVVDEAEILSPSTEQELIDLLAGHEAATGNQLVVVTLSSLRGYDIADYGVRLGRAWGIGQEGRDNGVILIVAPNERAVRIEVGYGLEATLTDATTRLIIEREIIPSFRAGDMEGGVVLGTRAILNALGGGYIPPPDPADEAARNELIGQIVVGVMASGFMAMIVYGFITSRRQRLQSGGRATRGSRSSSSRARGFTSRGSSGGSFRGGGGGFSGGGFSGGGGSFGGGGASGRW